MNAVIPTAKQEAVAKKVLIEKKSVSRAMREVGYAKTTAKNPKTITKAASWPQLMEKYLPDSKLAAVHKKLLEKKEVIVVHGEILRTGEIDPTAAKNGLDLAYKLKGRYAPEKFLVGEELQSLSDKELAEKIAEAEALVKRREAESSSSGGDAADPTAGEIPASN